MKEEDIYKENDYIEIRDEIYQILGVNTQKFTLDLEKVDLSKVQKEPPQKKMFQAKEFTTRETISLESLRGKYVLLDFWGVWCNPCIKELPHLKDLYDKTDRSKFEIVGIAVRSAPDRLQNAIELHDITWPQILSDEIAKAYEIERYPTTFLIDPEGNIIAKDLRGDELEKKILSLTQ
ncbi:MAG: TlpA family protein disulfide reductase [Tannerella sp.]|nr:TlpA family protein disulfide reductase [Tannerella sp.]